MGAIDTGAFALAQAGLVATEKSPELAHHWEAVATFADRFPLARPLNQIFMLRQKRAHTAGGVAMLDLMLHLVALFKGEPLANKIANALVHTRRDQTVKQRPDGILEAEKLPLSAKIIHQENN